MTINSIKGKTSETNRDIPKMGLIKSVKNKVNNALENKEKANSIKQTKKLSGIKTQEYILFLKTKEGLNELEKKSGIKIIRDDSGAIIQVNFFGLKNPKLFRIQEVIGSEFFKILRNKKAPVKDTILAKKILEEFFIREFGLNQANFIVSENKDEENMNNSELRQQKNINYLKTKEGLDELEKKSGIKIMRNNFGTIKQIDFFGLISNDDFYINGVKAGTFFKNLGNYSAYIYSKSITKSILKGFFIKEFGLTEDDFFNLKNEKITEKLQKPLFPNGEKFTDISQKKSRTKKIFQKKSRTKKTSIKNNKEIPEEVKDLINKLGDSGIQIIENHGSISIIDFSKIKLPIMYNIGYSMAGIYLQKLGKRNTSVTTIEESIEIIQEYFISQLGVNQVIFQT